MGEAAFLSPRRAQLIGALVSVAAVAVHAYALTHATLYCDDFQILIRSWTWPAAWQHLWEPTNEHIMPLGRLTTWLLVGAAGRPTALPLAAALQGPVAVVVGMWLLYAFVRRELGHPFYGLVAMTLFGVSSAYEQAVSWFAASFSVLALDTLLLALLAAQAWRRSGRIRCLLMSALAAALAPAWFASGILTGPLCTLYLLPRNEDVIGPPAEPNGDSVGVRARVPTEVSLADKLGLIARTPLPGLGRVPALIPLAGSVVFLLVSLPRTADQIMHLEHYAGKSALEAIQPKVGLEYTARSLVDNIIPGALGVSGVVCPTWLVPIGLLALTAAAVLWWQKAPRRRLVLLGLGCILCSYVLVYSARAAWDYEQMRGWTRYQLLPHLGLVFVITGGLPRWQNRWDLRSSGVLLRGQATALLVLAGVLWTCQVPRAVLMNTWRADLRPAQQRALALIEQADARCRRHHIAGLTARCALEWKPGFVALLGAAPAACGPACVPWIALAHDGWLDVPGCAGRENGWQFVRGSASPRSDLTVEEARRLLCR
jgi:hypothetical protein